MIHPRTALVTVAEGEMTAAVNDVFDKLDLTYAEGVSVLVTIIGRWMRYAIRVERHGPNSSKKGDEA
jgi:hypothetical protein